MAGNDGFGVNPEDLERFMQGAGEQVRAALGQFGRLFEGSGERQGWSTLFDQPDRRPRSTPEPETTGAAGDGVWAIYVVNTDGSAQVEEVYATELEALRANKHNTDINRKVRFLPYGMAVSVLDAPEEAPDGVL